MKTWREFMAKYQPDGDLTDPFNVFGYTVAATLEQVLKQCGDTLTRENVMKQAANLKHFRVETLLPGVTINTSPTDYAPIEAVQLERFNGKQFELFGDVISNEGTAVASTPR
jgi:branched-chain amino acid transport system substrate-binding protein